jgi:Glycosyltransferase family 87
MEPLSRQHTDGFPNSRNWLRRKPLIFLLIAAFLAFSMCFFVERVWAPPEGTRLSDLYSRWYGSRELLLHGRDPYGAAVTREVQVWAYGHPVDAAHPEGTRDEDRFAYPLYVAFLLAPTVGLPFSKVQSIFRLLLPPLALGTILLWVSMLRWRCRRSVLGAVILLSLGCFPVLESIYLQQPGLFAAAFLAGTGATLAAGWLGLAGVLLALATIKPQLTALIALWLLFWAVCDWRSRKRLIWGFALTMLLLAGGAEVLLPGWISEFAAGVVSYKNYTGSTSILTLLLSKYGGIAAQAALLLALALVAWRLRGEGAGRYVFNFLFCAVLAVTLVVIPTLYPTGQIMLLPAVFFLQQNVGHFWSLGRTARLGYVAVWCLIGWQWVGSAFLLLAAVAVPISRLRRWWLLPLDATFLVPLGILTLLVIWTPKMLASSQAESTG